MKKSSVASCIFLLLFCVCRFGWAENLMEEYSKKMAGDSAVSSEGSSASPQVPMGEGGVISPEYMAEQKQKILGDANLMASIMALLQDPRIMELVADKEFQELIMRQDITALQNNEKFQQFVENPAVQQVVADAVAKQKIESK